MNIILLSVCTVRTPPARTLYPCVTSDDRMNKDEACMRACIRHQIIISSAIYVSFIQRIELAMQKAP